MNGTFEVYDLQKKSYCHSKFDKFALCFINFDTMSVNLCIDWGNTYVKAAIFNNDSLAQSHQYAPERALEHIAKLADTVAPQKAILCSVSEQAAATEHFLQAHIRGAVTLGKNTRLPFHNAYSSPETLGADRIALAAGAFLHAPDRNNLVISLGTCITYNFITNNKTFRGGLISPGLQMRLHAMHQHTDKLPDVSTDGEVLLLGYDTETCIRSGAVLGMAAEIDGIIEDFNARYSGINCILTGGDAFYFAKKIKSKIFADPDLLLKGLNLILNYNVPIPR
jgi:type III pantothenate kinase